MIFLKLRHHSFQLVLWHFLQTYDFVFVFEVDFLRRFLVIFVFLHFEQKLHLFLYRQIFWNLNKIILFFIFVIFPWTFEKFRSGWIATLPFCQISTLWYFSHFWFFLETFKSIFLQVRLSIFWMTLLFPCGSSIFAKCNWLNHVTWKDVAYFWFFCAFAG